MPAPAKFQVGDQCYNNWGGSGTVTQVHGKKWVKTTFYKKWWTTDSLLTPDQYLAHKADQLAAQAINKAAANAQDAIEAIVNAVADPVNDVTAAAVAKLAAATGLDAKDAQAVIAAAAPHIKKGWPSAADQVAAEAVEPAGPVTKVVWKPVVPGTLSLGDVVSYPAYAGYDASSGTFTAKVVSVSGKAWVKLDCKKQWHKASTLCYRYTYQVLEDGTVAWNPVAPDWTKWKNYWTPWYNSLAHGEKTALLNYCGSGYAAINSVLRAGKTSIAHNSTVANLDAAINKGSMPFDLAVYRSGSSKFDVATPVGSVLEDLGFVSTSTDHDFAKKWHNPGVFMTIRVPAGTRCAYVQLISQHKHEREVILPRGTRFRLVELHHTPGSRAQATLEVLP